MVGMMRVHQPRTPALRSLYWRDELLELLFWIEGEGIGSEIDPATVDRFLGPESEIALEHLDAMVDDGLLDRRGERYGLSQAGREIGRKIFRDDFAALRSPGHGACGDECWCRQSADEAAACAGALTT